MNGSFFQHKSGTRKEMSAWSILRLVFKNLHWLLLSGAAIAAAVFFAVSFLVTPTYKPAATFYVYNSSNGVSTSGVINNNDLQPPKVSLLHIQKYSRAILFSIRFCRI